MDEDEVALGEKLAPELEKKVLRSGDEFLINISKPFLKRVMEDWPE